MAFVAGELDISNRSLLRMEAKTSLGLRGRYPTGRVIWSEDFENPGSTQSWYSLDGPVWRSHRSALKSHSGRYSMRMINQGSLVDIARTMPLDSSTTTKIGLEYWMAFSHQYMTTASFIGAAIERWTGTVFEEYQVLYVPMTNSWLEVDTPPASQNITTLNQLTPYDPTGNQGTSALSQAWHHIKVIVNLSSSIYQTLIVNNQSYDMSAFNLGPFTGKTITANARDKAQIRLELHCGAIASGPPQPTQVYYDDLILTDET